MAILTYNPREIQAYLTSLGHVEVGGVTEVRIFPKNDFRGSRTINGKRVFIGKTVSGYYDDYGKLVQDVVPFDGHADIYVTINPVKRDLLARAANRLEYAASATTSDADILADLWFPFDLDPVRPAKISSTDEELECARQRCLEVCDFFKSFGITPLIGMSGNGYHGLIRLIGYPNTEETAKLKERLTQFLAEKFSDERVKYDATVFNMARIWKLYGVMAVKGDHLPERPHRRSDLEIPDELPEPVELYAMTDRIIPVGWHSESHHTHTTHRHFRANDSDYPWLDVERYLTDYGYSFKIKKDKDGRTLYILDRCPFSPNHNQGEVCITQDALGKLGFKCFHNSCAGKTWQDAKDAIGDPKPFFQGSQTHSNSARNGNGEASQTDGTDASQDPAPNGDGKTSQTDDPKEKVSPEAEFNEIRRDILEAGMLDEGFERTEKTKEIINRRLVGLAPVDQAAFIERMRKADLGTKATLESQLKDAMKAQAQERRQTVISKPQPSELPNIVINTRQMREITADTLDAIRKADAADPSLFVRSGILTRIKVDEKGYALAQNLMVDGARGIMGRVANFLKETIREDIGTTYTAVSPPEVIAKDILSLPSYPQFPPLVSVVGFPILSESGEFRTQTGYDPESRCYYHATEKVHIGDIKPTEANVQNAKRLILEDVLGDFPFVDKASLANTVAEMLTPLVRPLIRGATPLFAHDAATPGTGKTLLASVGTIPFSLSGASIITAGRDDDEWRKRITAKLMTGTSHILIDNIKAKLNSGDLSAALTVKSDWEDRILGQSQMIRLPVRCVWIATGNNLEFSDEIARRAVWIRLDAKVERPWKRTDFKHKDLESWAEAHRSEILTALMVFVKKWFALGKPAGEEVMGSYSEWTQIVGGILKAVGIEGFLENADELYEQVDTEREVWVEFFKAWASEFGAYDEKSRTWGAWDESGQWRTVNGTAVGTQDLFPLASHSDSRDDPEGLGLLDSLLGRGDEHARRTNLGRILNQHKDRVFGHYRLERLKEKQKHAVQYRLVTGEPSGEPSDLSSPTQESSRDKAFNQFSDTLGEPSELKTTPSRKNAEVDNTSGRNSRDRAGMSSLGSPDSLQNGQQSSGDKDSGMGELSISELPQTHAFLHTWHSTCGNRMVYPEKLIPLAQAAGFDLDAHHFSPMTNIERILQELTDQTLDGLTVRCLGDGAYQLEGQTLDYEEGVI